MARTASKTTDLGAEKIGRRKFRYLWDLREPSEASWQAGLGGLWTLGWNAVSVVVGLVLIVAAAEHGSRVTTPFARSHAWTHFVPDVGLMLTEAQYIKM